MCLQALLAAPKQVKLANGSMMVTDQWASNMEWWASGHTLHSDMRVLELVVYDAILGYDWLSSHSPMIYNWDQNSGTHRNG